MGRQRRNRPRPIRRNYSLRRLRRFGRTIERRNRKAFDGGLLKRLKRRLAQGLVHQGAPIGIAGRREIAGQLRGGGRDFGHGAKWSRIAPVVKFTPRERPFLQLSGTPATMTR